MRHDPSTDDPDSRLAAAAAGSRTVALLRTLDDRLSSVGRGATATRLAARTRRVVVDSFSYRWLTAEPDPEVIVIDLRETYTVGPLVAALDRLAGRLGDATTGARTVVVGRGLAAECRAAPVRLVGVALAAAAALALLAGTALGALGPPLAVVLVALALAGLAGTRVTASWRDLADSRVGRLVVAVLEPPPVDESDATARETEEDDGRDVTGADRAADGE